MCVERTYLKDFSVVFHGPHDLLGVRKALLEGGNASERLAALVGRRLPTLVADARDDGTSSLAPDLGRSYPGGTDIGRGGLGSRSGGRLPQGQGGGPGHHSCRRHHCRNLFRFCVSLRRSPARSAVPLLSLSLRKYPRRFFAFWTRNLIVNQSAISTLLSNSAFSTLAHVIDVNRDPPASWPGERIASTSKRVGVWAQREGRESSRSRSRARKARGLRAQPVRAE